MDTGRSLWRLAGGCVLKVPITDPFVLPSDVLLVPVKDLPEAVQKQIDAEQGDYALTRPHSRTPSRVVDGEFAELLKQFRTPKTIVQAVIQYSRERNGNPERLLEEAYPVLDRLARASFLVPSDSDEAKRIQPSLVPGTKFLDFEIVGCVQALEDTEVYEAKLDRTKMTALKLLRSGADPGAVSMFDREAAILKLLAGEATPQLLDSGAENGRHYLLLEWCSGVDCFTLASQLRQFDRTEAADRISELCLAILAAYSRLHEKNVVHSDVHPRNILVDALGNVKLIDFGLARVAGFENELRRAPRGGIGFFFEPEYAKSLRARKQIPASTKLGEQYALGALLYYVLTGAHYLDFSAEKHEMFRQIAEDRPIPFSARGTVVCAELEPVIRRALSKEPSERYPTVADFREALMAARAKQKDLPAHSVDSQPVPYPSAQHMLANLLARLDSREPLFRTGIETAPRVSVTYGAAGAAFGLYRIACAREDAELLALADLWATRAARDMHREDAFYNSGIEITPESVGRISPYHTAAGVHLVQACIARAMGDVASQQTAIDRYLEAAGSTACENPDVALGQSGVLLGSAFLLDSTSGVPYLEAARLVEFGNQTLSLLWDKLGSFPPLRECREISYSGAAHGWAGMLYATLSWCRASGTAIPFTVCDRLDQLGRFADRYGSRARWRFSTRASRNQNGAYMGGWCNGSAGFVFLWTLAHRMLHASEFAELAEQSGFDAWQCESEIGNLCCGYAGQSYAMLNLYRYSGDKVWLHRAQTLAERAAAAANSMPPGDAFKELAIRAESLYKGELGIAVLAADLDRPAVSAMPMFEPEI